MVRNYVSQNRIKTRINDSYNKEIFKSSALVTSENGERLLDDAEELYDIQRYPTAFGLAVLSQEEFAKAFIFELISEGIIDWHPYIKRLINNHHTKQLIGLVLDLLSPSDEDILDFFESNKWNNYAKKAFDAINILGNSEIYLGNTVKLVKNRFNNYDNQVVSIIKGQLEKQKQNSIYIEVNKKGQVIYNPSLINEIQTKKMIDRATGFAAINRVIKDPKYVSPDFDKIKDTFKAVFNKLKSN